MNAPSRFRRAREAAVVLLASTFTACASLPDGGPFPAVDSPDEVQIGYGTQDARDLTGAVASVTQDDLDGWDATTLEDMINGRFAGVRATRGRNGQISIRIRGTTSLMGSGEPLYVIDGMPLYAGASAVSALNPRDILRIDILKDAGATAIYGSRGANGVVIITTRR